MVMEKSWKIIVEKEWSPWGALSHCVHRMAEKAGTLFAHIFKMLEPVCTILAQFNAVLS